jgi:hypothetical protein
MKFESVSFKFFVAINGLMLGIFIFLLGPAILLGQLEFNRVEIVSLLSIYMGMSAIISIVFLLKDKIEVSKWFLVEFLLLFVIFLYLSDKFNF